jgi:hypothetical protein
MFGVVLCAVHCCFGVMLFGLKKVAMSNVRVMVALPVVAFLMRLGSFVMMLRRMFMMFCGFRVVIGEFLSGHCFLLGVSSAPRCTIGPSCDIRMKGITWVEHGLALVRRPEARSLRAIGRQKSRKSVSRASPCLDMCRATL